jgi:DNA-binding beta-propeller fold protein YncE
MHRLWLSALVGSAALLGAGPVQAFDGWRQESATILEGKPSAFDYIGLDRGANRLFLGHRKAGLQIFDPVGRKLIATLGDTAAHSSDGATLMPEFDLGISNNEDGTLTPFKLSTLEAQPSVKVSEELDTSHYDPATKRVFVNAASGPAGQDIVILDAPSLKLASTLHMASKKLEGADADGKGGLYLAEQDLGKIARIDAKAMTLAGEWPTPGCEKPTAVAVNAADNRLYLACRKGAATKPAFLVLDLDTGGVIYSAEIGDGVDGLIYDAGMKRIFMACGLSATLHVFEIDGPDAYKPVETLTTRQWIKVLALDPERGKLYSMAAEGSADAGKKINANVSPFYPNTVFPNTFTVFSYSK